MEPTMSDQSFDRRPIICEPCGHACPDAETTDQPSAADWGVDDFAEAAYNAYSSVARGRSLVTGAPLPDWPTMRRTRPDVAEAWVASANAVRSMVAGHIAAQVARDATRGPA
jgi:hypothetical protein